MDYEEKYKEALERARKLQKTCDNTAVIGWCEYIFPELKESENEKIRKALIEMVHDTTYDELWVDYNVHKEEALAWLEKQGEQKSFDYENANIQQKDFAPQEDAPRYSIGDVLCDKSCTTLNKDAQPNYEIVDIRNGLYICDKGYIPISQQDEYELVAKKIEPKFKVGDWITNGDYTWKIVEIKPLDYILQSQDGNIVDDTISHVDEQFHSFTIEDAKDGDVLLFEGYYNSIVLFQGIGINGKGRINYHCKCDLGNYSFGVQGDVACLGTIEKDSEHYHPATKEQRDLLFQKMHEAGYEWDAEKKELKLLITNGGDFEFENCEQKPANEEMIETLRTEYEKGRADAIAEMQKGWSEEDERICRSIVADIANDKSICKYEISKSICDE